MSEQPPDAEGLPEVADWIEEKIEFRSDREVQDHHIIKIIRGDSRPFVPCSYVASETTIGSDGMRPRLKKFGLLKRALLTHLERTKRVRRHWLLGQLRVDVVPRVLTFDGGARGEDGVVSIPSPNDLHSDRKPFFLGQAHWHR